MPQNAALCGNGLSPSQTTAAFLLQSNSVQENCRLLSCVHYDNKDHCSNAVASPVDAVGLHKWPSHSVHFEHAQSAAAWRLNQERSKVTVRSP